MAIHKTDDGVFVIASGGSWLPGAYEDKRTARFAFRLPNETLSRLQRAANARAGGYGGVVTWGDLALASEQARGKTPYPDDCPP
jgi:hypothetical protein